MGREFRGAREGIRAQGTGLEGGVMRNGRTKNQSPPPAMAPASLFMLFTLLLWPFTLDRLSPQLFSSDCTSVSSSRLYLRTIVRD